MVFDDNFIHIQNKSARNLLKNKSLKQADVVFCRPGCYSAAERKWAQNLPLGIGYLSSYVRAQGISVDIVDAKIEKHTSTDETISAIMFRSPKYLGLSAMTVEYPAASLIADSIKNIQSPPVVILGGVHASALPEATFRDAASIDYLITGQGEESLVALLNCLEKKKPLTSVPGLLWRDDNGIIRKNPPKNKFKDLTDLPFPAWDLWPRRSMYPIMMERGCPYQCVFCCHNSGRIVRSRPVEHVFEEIRWLRERFCAQTINFEDETFGLYREKTRELLQRCIEYNRDGKITFGAQTRVDCVSQEMVVLMKRAGFKYIGFGIESGDDGILKKAKKGITLEQIKHAVRTARSAGLKLWANFMIGLPGETRETALKTIRLAAQINPERFAAAVIVAYPGCKIYEWAQKNENGYRLLSGDFRYFDKYLSTSVELETLDASSLKRLQIRLFIEVYLRNGRFVELFTLILKDIPLVFKIIQSTLFPRSSNNAVEDSFRKMASTSLYCEQIRVFAEKAVHSTDELFWSAPFKEMVQAVSALKFRIKPMRVLDIGYGEGRSTVRLLLATSAHVVHAVDTTRNNAFFLKHLIHVLNSSACAYPIQASTLSLPYGENMFDVVYCCSVLQYVDTEKALNEMHRVLKPHGRIYVIANMQDNPFVRIFRSATQKRRSFPYGPACGYMPYNSLKTWEREGRCVLRNVYHFFFPLFYFLFKFIPYAPAKSTLFSVIEFLDSTLIRAFPFLRRFAWLCFFEIPKKL